MHEGYECYHIGEHLLETNMNIVVMISSFHIYENLMLKKISRYKHTSVLTFIFMNAMNSIKFQKKKTQSLYIYFFGI